MANNELSLQAKLEKVIKECEDKMWKAFLTKSLRDKLMTRTETDLRDISRWIEDHFEEICGEVEKEKAEKRSVKKESETKTDPLAKDAGNASGKDAATAAGNVPAPGKPAPSGMQNAPAAPVPAAASPVRKESGPASMMNFTV